MSIDAPTAATLCVGMLSATAVVTSTIWKMVPQKHVVQTKEGDRCATAEQVEAVAAIINKRIDAQNEFISNRFYDFMRNLSDISSNLKVLTDRRPR